MESPQRVSGSAVERSTPPPPRVSVVSDGGSPTTLVQVSFLLLLGSRALVSGFCIQCFAAHILYPTWCHSNKQQSTSEPIIPGTHGTSLFSSLGRHSRAPTPQTQHDRDSHPRSLRRKRTGLSPVVHTLACPYPHRLLRVLDHPSSHSSTVSLHSVVSIPAKSPSHTHRSLPLPHLSVVRPIRAILQNAHATRKGHRRGYAVVSVRHCTCVCVPRYLTLHTSLTCIYSHPHANCTCMPSYDSLHIPRRDCVVASALADHLCLCSDRDG